MPLDTPNSPETQAATFAVPNSLLGRLLDHGKASAHAIKMLCIKLAHFNFDRGALNKRHCREHYSIGWRAFDAGRRLMVKTRVIERSQPNHRDYAVETLARGGRNYVETDMRLIKEPASLVAFVLTTLLSPRPVRPVDVAKRIGVESGNTVRKLALDATRARYVGRAVAPDGTAYVGRHKVIQEAVTTPLKNGTAKNGTAKNGGAHMYWEKSTETESKNTAHSKVSAARQPHGVQRQQDEVFRQQLKRLTNADLAQVLAPKLRANARGLGAFLAGQAKTHAVSTGDIVEIIEEALPGHLMDEEIRQVTTWGFYTRRIAKQIRLRHMTAEGIRPGDVSNVHKRMDDNEQP